MSDVLEKEPVTIVKREDFAILYSDGSIVIKDVRCSYPHFFKKYKGDDSDGEGKFSGVFLMPKTPDRFKSKDLVKGEIDRIIHEAKLKGLPAANKFLRDGDLAAKDEYEGMFTINASETHPPQLRDNVRDPKTKKLRHLVRGVDDDRILPGYWVNVRIRPWYQDNKFGKKVNANLLAVQFVREDATFGEARRLTDDDVDESFGEFASDDDSGYDDSLGADDNEL
jgi:Protein of unknown function (DUF2815)